MRDRIANMSTDTVYMVFLVMMLLHLHLVILRAMDVISMPWVLILLPEIIIAITIVGGITLVSVIVIYAYIYTYFGRRRHNGK